MLPIEATEPWQLMERDGVLCVTVTLKSNVFEPFDEVTLTVMAIT